MPKEGLEKPWQKGDEPLSPFEEYAEPVEHTDIHQRMRENVWYNAGKDAQEVALQTLLGHYLHEDEVLYYMKQIRLKAGKSYDSYMQVIQVIQDKEKQPKFKSGTDAYRRNSIIKYALRVNLKEFGWSLEPMNAPTKRKQKSIQQDLFCM